MASAYLLHRMLTYQLIEVFKKARCMHHICNISAAGVVAELLASLLQGPDIPPERQAAFTDCVQDALRNSSSIGTTAVALQALQGFIDGNG